MIRPRSRPWDDQGASSISLSGIVILILIIWQIGIPYFGLGSSLTDTLGITEPDPEVISFDGLLIDIGGSEVSSTGIVSDYAWVDLLMAEDKDDILCYNIPDTQEEDHSLSIETNVPKDIFSPWILQIERSQYKISAGAWETIFLDKIDYSYSPGDKVITFRITEETMEITSGFFAHIRFILIAPTGNAHSIENMVIC